MTIAADIEALQQRASTRSSTASLGLTTGRVPMSLSASRRRRPRKGASKGERARITIRRPARASGGSPAGRPLSVVAVAEAASPAAVLSDGDAGAWDVAKPAISRALFWT